jgi:hypothetical protein
MGPLPRLFADGTRGASAIIPLVAAVGDDPSPFPRRGIFRSRGAQTDPGKLLLSIPNLLPALSHTKNYDSAIYKVSNRCYALRIDKGNGTMNFHDFKAPIQAQFNQMARHDLFCVDISGDELWQHYLASFPAGTNPIYRERTEHDCSCCRQFVKTLGGVVTIVNGHVQSIWDAADISEPAYQAVARAMAVLVASKAIDRPFLHYEKHVGTDKNYGEIAGKVETYAHFFVEVPWAKNQGKNFVCPGKDIATRIGEARSTHDVLLRSLTTLTQDALDTVLEVIANQSLYRGEEQKFAVTEFSKLKKAFDKLPARKHDMFVWANYDKVPGSVARIRNTAIGTLLIDLSEGLDLEDAVRKFETSVMAPTNYKRPTALVSKAMVEKARKTVAELGIEDALERRHARLTDIKVTDILFADRAARKVMGDVFDTVPVKATAKSMDKVETVGIDQFVGEILPRVDSLEVMLENKHVGNMVSLIAPQHRDSRPLFKWGNGFSWTYNGEVTDSIKDRVKRAGGNVTGDLCCRLSWFNYDDLDLHMTEINRRYEIYYGNRQQRSPNGGQLDVDMNAVGRQTREPVENIFYGNQHTMREGDYVLSVHQFTKREAGNIGFDVEIDWLGDVKRFHYEKALRTGEKVGVAYMRYSRTKGIEFIDSIPSTQASRTVWGLKSQDFHRVTTMMLSPNHWGDGNGTGNKHFFFMLDGCLNEDRPRGFFNEFLIDELTPHRKVIEIVGAKSKVEPSTDQLSGLGFSSTQRNELLVRAKGSFTRIVKIAF